MNACMNVDYIKDVVSKITRKYFKKVHGQQMKADEFYGFENRQLIHSSYVEWGFRLDLPNGKHISYELVKGFKMYDGTLFYQLIIPPEMEELLRKCRGYIKLVAVKTEAYYGEPTRSKEMIIDVDKLKEKEVWWKWEWE